MYRNRALVRSEKIRTYYNQFELNEVEQGAEAAGLQTAEFIREATLVVSRYIKAKQGKASVAQLGTQLALLATRPQFNEMH